jgi:hypothetical protein
VPLSLGGSWNIAGQSIEHCNGEAHPDSVSVSCTALPSDLDVLRNPSSDKTVPGVSTAQRRASLSSIFGDFGGSWTVITPSATCDVTFQDSSFNASCSGNGAQGSVNLTFTDGLASGKTSNGGELSAKRR